MISENFRRLLAIGSVLLGFSISLHADIPTNIKPVSVGLGGFNYYTTGPFANTALTGGEWLEYGTDWGTTVYFQNTDGTPNPQFNANGLPKYLNTGKKLRLLLWPYYVNSNTGAPASWPVRGNTGVGKWVVTWQGTADIRLNGATFISAESSGTSTGSLVNGRRVYNMGAANPSGHITVEAINAANPPTDLKVWLPDPTDPQNRSLESSGQFWHPKFLSYLSAMDFNHLRFMDWGETNASPQLDWVDRRIPGHLMQHGTLNRRSPAAGVVFYTNSSGQPVYFSGNRKTGIAYEHMVALSNATGKDAWICVPHLATNDYITKLAQLLNYGSDGVNPYTSPQANPVYPPLDPARKVWIEYSNEIWSNGDSFAQGNWAQAQGESLGLGTGTDAKAKFNARRYAQIWKIFQLQFGGSSRIVRVAGIFTGNDSYNTPFLTELKAYAASLSPTVSVDAIAPTTYFGNGIQDWAYEQANLNRGKPSQWFHTAADFVHDTNSGATRPVSVPLTDPYWASTALADQQAQTFVEWKKRIFSGSTAAGGGPDSTGVGGGFSATLRSTIFSIFGQRLPIVAYEGGPSLYTDYLDGGDSRDDGLTNFNIAFNRLPAFAEIQRIQLNMARAKGLNSTSMFVDVSQWSKYGQWGHLEYPDQIPSSSVRWKAVSDWAADMANIRPIDDLINTRPTFTTAGTLPRATYLTPCSRDIVATGGDVAAGSSLDWSVIGSQMLAGLTVAPLSGDPTRYRISGTPTAGGSSYVYLRVNDDDGDASWQIFSIYTAGGAGTVLESDPTGPFNGASSLPWTQTAVLDSAAVSWSGLNRGAAYISSGGSAIGTDGTGVQLYTGTNAIRFSVSQGAVSQSQSTLASAIIDNEYWKFTVTPQSGQPLNLRNAEFRLSWNREQYHSSRNFVLMTSIGGFSSGAQVYTLSTTPAQSTPTETVFRLPDTSAYSNLTAPVEFRIYFYGSQYGHIAQILGLKLTRDSAFSAYQTWSSTIAWNGADSTPSADPDGDGFKNLMEYALGLNPIAASASPITSALNAGLFSLTYPRTRAGIDYSVETSIDLSVWTPTGVTQDTTTPVGGTATATIPFNTATDSRLFLRLKVTE